MSKIRALIVATILAMTGVVAVSVGDAAALTGCGPAHTGSPPSFTWGLCTGGTSGLYRVAQSCKMTGIAAFNMYGAWVASPYIVSQTGNCNGTVQSRWQELTF
jgi:hypothetical protein